jgi:hypothetical protein
MTASYGSELLAAACGLSHCCRYEERLILDKSLKLTAFSPVSAVVLRLRKGAQHGWEADRGMFPFMDAHTKCLLCLLQG